MQWTLHARVTSPLSGRAEPKKFLATTVLINSLLLVHEILHVQWFATRGYFTPVALLFVLHFLLDMMLLKLLVKDPGIQPPILKDVTRHDLCSTKPTRS